MKTLIIFLFCFFIFSNLFSQGIAINTSNADPDDSAMLDVSSTTKGVLIPRMLKSERDAITATAATGLMIFQIDQAQGFYYYNGSSWESLGADVLAINDLVDAISDGSSVFLGTGSGLNDDGSNANVGVGINSLSANTSGLLNTALGVKSLQANTSGIGNTAIGHETMLNNSTGGNNTSIGISSLRANLSGSYNSALGDQSLNKNTIGSHNTGVGYQALYLNTSGFDNIAIGSNALEKNNASGNTVIGKYALQENTSGQGNVGVGFGANRNNQTGSYNTILGYEAGNGPSNISKSYNVFLGYRAGYNETGSNKLYIENSNSSIPLIGGDFDIDELYLNGKVGIGTMTPLTKLQVNGNITFSPAGLTSDESRFIGQSIASQSTFDADIGFGGMEVENIDKPDTDDSAQRLHFWTHNQGLDSDRRMTIDTTGKVGIGTTEPSSNLEVVNDQGVSTITATTYRNITAYNAGQFIGRAARGFRDSPSAVQMGDQLATFNGRGYGETGFSDRPRGRLSFTAAENWTDDSQGTYLWLTTTPLGTATNVERMRITSQGNVGIGTSTPSELLEVEGGSGGELFGISIKQNTNNIGYPSLFFKDVSDNELASIFPHQTKTHLYFRLNSGDFIFDRFGGSSPQMSLKENGNLGIGTTTPDEKLHVAGGVRIDGALEDKDGEAGTAGQILSSTATGTDWIDKTEIAAFANAGEAGGADRTLGNTDNFGLGFLTNNSNRVQITNDGKTGIGTITPSELLEVEGGSAGGHFGISISQNTNSTGYPGLHFKDENNNKVASILTHQNRAQLYFRLTSGDFVFDRSPSSDVHMVLKESGNLGIGTTTPDEKLHVAGGVRIDGALEDKDGEAGSAGQILSSTATGTDWIDKTEIAAFANAGEAGGADRTLGNTDNFGLGFLTNNSNRVQITNDGKIGIGTITPSELLEVEGGSAGGHFGVSISQNTNSTGYPGLHFKDENNNKVASILTHQNRAQLYFRLTSGDFVFDRSPSSDVHMVLKESGNLGIGTTTPDEKLHVAGGVRIDGALEDKDGEAGSAGQILSSTATGTDWIPKTDITDFTNGGEAGGADRSMGNTDNFALSLLTNNTSRQKIFNDGGIRFDGNVGIFTDPKAPGINKAIDLYDSGTFSNPYLKISGHNSGSIELVSRRTDITNGKSWRIGSGSGSALNLDRFYIYNSDDGNVFTIRDGGNIGIGADIPTAKIDINGSTGYNQLRLQTSYTPTSSSDTNGNIGDIAWDESFMYVKTNAGWKRTSLETF